MEHAQQTDIDLSPLEIRLALFAHGYSPVLARGKISDVAGWRTPVSSIEEISALTASNPSYQNTGLLCGPLVALDIDAPDPETAAALLTIADALPGADRALRRIGKAPKVCLFFRATEVGKKVETPEYVVGGHKSQVEVMQDGQQVLAFGIHPDTQLPYTWVGPSPLDIPFADLPEITPASIADFVNQADTYLRTHGAPVREQKKTAPRSNGGATFWQRVNTAALENTDAWVQSLFSSASKEVGTGAWRITSRDLGRDLQEDISIHRDGIQDFGLEQSETPISLVEKWGGAPTPKDAAHWLCEKLGRDPADFGWQRDLGVRMTLGSLSKTPAIVAANDDEDHDEEVYEAETAEEVTGLPESLCFPPGAVGDFARFIVDCARFPSPHLALVSALALTGGLIGRRYKGPTKLRSNIYAIGLAESGFGKDNTIRTSAAIADSTDIGSAVSQSIFMDKIRSMPGIATKLRKSPSCVAVVDEFGSFLKTIAGDNISEGKDEIRSALMELTGAPMGYWGGMERAAGNIPRIVQPCFSIHGISTPTTFWDALSSGNISEGLLGRLVLIDVGNAEPVKVMNPKCDPDNVPNYLSQHVKNLLGATGKGRYSHGPMYALAASSEAAPYPMVTADWESRAVQMLFEDFDNEIRGRKRRVDPKYRPILNRVAENAGRLALIVAAGCDYQHPVITHQIQAWANAVAENALNVIMTGATENIADNALQKEYMRVRNIVTRTKKTGITHGMVLKTVAGSIQNRRIDDILLNLRKAKEVHLASWIAPSGQTQVRYWGVSSMPKDATIQNPWVE
ncbi:bifunctional DNA primase/polymerase [Sinorhizobium medicae]|uniref:bifunctional DNA primase/polymerase n=1 Tax=Sinorhizobium medicae TaxID=110321 RepID=UPI0012981611|nr:bifunctional DNA primase/polymerase [Sinorhizobium medicae]MQX77484.1 DNA primase [Sinorhizobium medicae]